MRSPPNDPADGRAQPSRFPRLGRQIVPECRTIIPSECSYVEPANVGS